MNTKLYCLLLLLIGSISVHAQCGRTGTFTAIDDPGTYPVSGTANLTFYLNGTKEVTFGADFSTVQGLNLQVYLTTTQRLGQGGNELLISTQPLQDDNGGMDTNDPITGMKTFSIPASVELDDYDYVIIQCINADVLWGRADLSALESGPDCNVLTINENELSKTISLFPNPAIDKFSIANTLKTPLEISIYNTLGEQIVKVEKAQLKKQNISLSNLNSGVYLVEIKSSNQRIVKKLIKR